FSKYRWQYAQAGGAIKSKNPALMLRPTRISFTPKTRVKNTCERQKKKKTRDTKINTRDI
ncbi:hypothetical protein, partial [Methylicorpusculum sp.]|uniref:hypothetical protein n=1 Tax=Methylicorpusculum sp. TaxID=2713644 RepID=UPI002ABABCD1